MKKILLGLILILLINCNKSDSDLSPAITDSAFTFHPSINNANELNFVAFNSNINSIWDYGDGTSGNGSHSTHIYQNAGTYNVLLTVDNEYGSNFSNRDLIIEHDVWNFDDNQWIDSSEFNLGFIGNTEPTFNIGDQVNIIQDEGYILEGYNGNAVINAIYQKQNTNWIIGIDKNYISSTNENSGKIVFSP